MKLKVEFNKYQKTGQNFFTRSLSVESLDLLLIMCDKIEVHYTIQRKLKKTGEITFIFSGELNRFAKVKNVPYYILKKFIPADQWKLK